MRCPKGVVVLQIKLICPLGGSVKKRGITLVQTGNNRKWDKNNLQTKLSSNSHFSCNDMPCIGCPFCMGKGNLDKKFF